MRQQLQHSLATSAAAEIYQNPRTDQTLGSSQSTFNESSHQNETPDTSKQPPPQREEAQSNLDDESDD